MYRLVMINALEFKNIQVNFHMKGWVAIRPFFCPTWN
jgi:hypothetical protein